MSSKWMKVVACLAIVAVFFSTVVSCAPATPEVVEKEVIVEKEVPVTVEVEKEKIVEKKVVETVEVEKEVVVEKEVTKEVVVTATPVPSKGPVQGGTLTIGMYGEPDILDSHTNISRHSNLILQQIHDSMLAVDQDFNLYPGLIESWEISKDNKTITYHLRKDVKFHDGTPFDAEAACYNYDRCTDPDVPAVWPWTLLGPNYESCEVVGDYTINLHFSRPNATLLLNSAIPRWLGQMVSPTVAEKAGVDDYGLNPVGTGPFKFVEWVPQSHIILERNPDYNWAPEILNHQGPAYLDRVVFKILTEDVTRLAALETGETDICIQIPPHDVARIREDERFTVQKVLHAGIPATFIFNTNKWSTDDVRVRRALNLWVDRELLCDQLWAGEKSACAGVLSPATRDYWSGAEAINAMDREKAMELLKEAGWEDHDGDGLLDKDGKTMKILVYSCGTSTAYPEALDGQFREMGADPEVVIIPWEKQKSACYEGVHNMMIRQVGTPDASYLRRMFHSSGVGELGPKWDHLDEADPELQAELDALLDEAEETLDPAKRQLIYWKVQEIVAENAIMMPLCCDYYIFGISKKVQGWGTTSLGNNWPFIYDLWLEE